MRKLIFPRLKALLAAACATLYTRRTQPATSKFSLEPETGPVSAPDDAWLFETEAAIAAVRAELSKDMNGLAESLSDLRETLALIHGDTPFPIEATTLTPCAIVHHDDALFEGEIEIPVLPAQEETSGGDGVFLFDDAASFEDDAAQHQHAA